MEQRFDQISKRVDDSAITRYKKRLDAKHPIRERDLRFPGRATLLGCIWTKLAMILITVAFLIMHSVGLDGNNSIENPLATWLIVSDVAMGCTVYSVVSMFTYCYLRTKSPALGIILFVVACAIVVLGFVLWEAMSTSGGFPRIISIALIITSLLSFVTDIWGFITYNKKAS